MEAKMQEAEGCPRRVVDYPAGTMSRWPPRLGAAVRTLEKDKMMRPVYGYNATSLMRGVTENEEYGQVDHSDNPRCT
ncbi:MAG TPA: hypothetical protein VII97_11620, partial [Anaerolineales bacterium]